MAVLVLDREVGTATLQLSDQPARRGTWYTTTNLAGDNTIDQPRHYDLLGMGHSREGLAGWYLLSGLQPYRRAAGAADWTDHGASGSAVTTIPADGNPPRVVGIIIGGFHDRPADPAWLRSMFGFELTGPTTATPKIDYMTPAAVIAAAIAAASARQPPATRNTTSPAPPGSTFRSNATTASGQRPRPRRSHHPPAEPSSMSSVDAELARRYRLTR